MPRCLTVALYKFVLLPDFAQMRPALLATCLDLGVKGTILLAREGVNGTIAGSPEGVHAVLSRLRTDTRLSDLEHKESWAQSTPFLRMKVRLKAEIVTMQVPGLDAARDAGTYVKPQDWNALIAQPDVVVIDTRNNYEVGVGSFEGALNPATSSFSELPEWIRKQSEPGGVLACVDGKRPRVAMFCTGGVRCEKSTALLRMQGFEEVYHLQGGILKYLEQVPPEQSSWRGECFVFDERVSVSNGLKPGSLDLCRSCRRPLSALDKSSPKYRAGVSCASCFERTSDEQKKGFAERQRQVELARSRNRIHLGVAMPVIEQGVSEDLR
ncbi:MAG: rhodanese-related sulfurtransferase [Burkholderiaceae bacterium]